MHVRDEARRFEWRLQDPGETRALARRETPQQAEAAGAIANLEQHRVPPLAQPHPYRVATRPEAAGHQIDPDPLAVGVDDQVVVAVSDQQDGSVLGREHVGVGVGDAPRRALLHEGFVQVDACRGVALDLAPPLVAQRR